MVVADRVQEALQKLPVSLQVEVLDYAEYLLTKWEREANEDSQTTEAHLSLTLAMRGMEDEETPAYGVDDLRVVF